jgi:hypothetical protein
MVNMDLVGGLRSALERGESLKQGMMSLFNSGYKREEIEEAARNLDALPAVRTFQQVKSAPVNPLPQTPSVPEKKEIKVEEKKQKLPPVKIQPYPQLQVAPQVQKVSYYAAPPSDKAVITILTVVLVFLLSVLVTIFVFKNELINFFSNLLA